MGQLAGHKSWFVVCLWSLSSLSIPDVTVNFTFVARLLVWPGCVSLCTPVSVPLFAWGLVLSLCVCVCYSFISLCPTLYCNTFSFPPHCSCFSARPGSLDQKLAGSLCRLLHWGGKQTVRCTNTGSAAFLMQAPAGCLSLCSELAKAETWATSLTADVFLRVSVSSISLPWAVLSTLSDNHLGSMQLHWKSEY